MTAHSKMRKIASRIHGRRKTYPINGGWTPDGQCTVRPRSAVRTVLRMDTYTQLYELRTLAHDGCFSPANTLQVPARQYLELHSGR